MEILIMFKVEASLDHLTQALDNNDPVCGTGKGYWYIEGILERAMRRIFGRTDQRWTSLAKSFCLALDDAEKKMPILFPTEKITNNPYLSTYHSYLIIAKKILNNMPTTPDESVKESRVLKRRYVSLLYRLEGINGGLDTAEAKKEVLEKLVELASAWKQQQSILFDKVISERERRALAEAAQYPEFVKLLFQDADLKTDFMLWVIQDKNAAGPFIQYPALQQKIVDCNLNGRIGRTGGTALRIKKEMQADGSLLKVLTLPFEGKELNILNEKLSFTFRGNYTLTIKEIFNIFKNKKNRIGNLEFLKGGITNWNNHRLGWWDADKQIYQTIDLSKTNWWSQLPIFEILTKQEAQHKYGWHLDGIRWNAAATASRGSPSLDFERSHAYLEIAIPLSDGKHYAIYDFGKFADEFPSSPFESLSMLCLNVHATIAYPDENIFYSHRQHAHHSFCMDPAEGIKLFSLIKKDILLSREKNFIYQIESENCAKWSQELLIEVLGPRVPNLFKMPLLQTEPIGYIAKIFDLIKKLPEKLQTKVLTFLHLPFGAAKGTWIIENGKKVRKSLTTHEFWETAEVYLPAFLHKQKEVGALNVPVEAAAVYHAISRDRTFEQAYERENFSPTLSNLLNRFIETFKKVFAFTNGENNLDLPGGAMQIRSG